MRLVATADLLVKLAEHWSHFGYFRLTYVTQRNSEKIEKKEETASRVNSRIVPVCCTILTYVHNYVNIVTVDYLLSCLVKLVKIYSFFNTKLTSYYDTGE